MLNLQQVFHCYRECKPDMSSRGYEAEPLHGLIQPLLVWVLLELIQPGHTKLRVLVAAKIHACCALMHPSGLIQPEGLLHFLPRGLLHREGLMQPLAQSSSPCSSIYRCPSSRALEMNCCFPCSVVASREGLMQPEGPCSVVASREGLIQPEGVPREGL